MRRADRLFRIVQHLRGRRLTTAAQLAQWLEVSQRTVYRDVRDLLLSGVPIDGEAGVGYRIRPGFDLPPLMFTYDEIEALVAGARIVQAWGGPALGAGARSALAKIASALPAEKRAVLEQTRLYAPAFHVDQHTGAMLEISRNAIAERTILLMVYRAADQQTSQRNIWPLGLHFWGGTWTLGAWCEQRTDFRTFRIDRIVSLQRLGNFPDVEGRRLADYVRMQEGCE